VGKRAEREHKDLARQMARGEKISSLPSLAAFLFGEQDQRRQRKARAKKKAEKEKERQHTARTTDQNRYQASG